MTLQNNIHQMKLQHKMFMVEQILVMHSYFWLYITIYMKNKCGNDVDPTSQVTVEIFLTLSDIV